MDLSNPDLIHEPCMTKDEERFFNECFNESRKDLGFVTESVIKSAKAIAKNYIETKTYQESGIVLDTVLTKQIHDDVMENM